MEKGTPNTKMWSYKMTYDSLFAPNPFWGVLTLATCKPVIRCSRNSQEGTWIAGWTACTVHNADAYGVKIDHYNMGQEKLIYLARIDEQIPLDEYWSRFPQKRNCPESGFFDARYSGDNIYHKEHTNSVGDVIAEDNECGHSGLECAKRDYHFGKNALICYKFFYFTRDNRLDIPYRFRVLAHKSKGQSLKCGPLVDEFIEYVENYSKQLGVESGIIGDLPIMAKAIEDIVQPVSPKVNVSCKKKGCSK